MGITQTLTFPTGGNEVINVSVPIISDTLVEGPEEFFSTLDNLDPRSVIILGENTAFIMIIDNDGVCVCVCVCNGV